MKYNEKKLVLEKIHDGDSIRIGNTNKYVEVFKDPTSSELFECIDNYGARLGFDSSLNLYSWESSIMHYDISNTFNITFIARLIFNKASNTIEFSGYGINKLTTKFINENIDTIKEKLKVAFSGRNPVLLID
jgi:hypothetical protein